jgi:hypothetical protein
LISKEAPPAWRKFAKAGSADEKTIKKMIAECPSLPLPADYTDDLADRLAQAVPPIYIAEG